MTSVKTTFLSFALAVTMASCTSKGEPHKPGEILVPQQIKTLASNQSMNGKLVTIEGYASFCGAFSSVTVGKKNKMNIYADGFCKGDKLIDAQIAFGGNSIPLSGEELRNYAQADKSFENSTLKFITDDYQEIVNGKLKFSGIIIYNGKDYHLDSVTIHK